MKKPYSIVASKRLRYISLILSFIIILNSCSHYQYFTFNSAAMEKVMENNFCYESDKYSICYNLSGPNCPLNIEIFNRDTLPVFVNLSRSYVQLGSEVYEFWNINDELAGLQNISHLNDEIINYEKILFIPPNTKRGIQPLFMQTEFFPKEALKMERDPTGINKENTKVKFEQFDKDASPLFFESNIAISLSDNFPDYQNYHSEFWINSIVQTYSSPAKYPDKENSSYVEEQSEISQLVSGFAALSLLTMLIVIFSYDGEN